MHSSLLCKLFVMLCKVSESATWGYYCARIHVLTNTCKHHENITLKAPSFSSLHYSGHVWAICRVRGYRREREWRLAVFSWVTTDSTCDLFSVGLKAIHLPERLMKSLLMSVNSKLNFPKEKESSCKFSLWVAWISVCLSVK